MSESSVPVPIPEHEQPEPPVAERALRNVNGHTVPLPSPEQMIGDSTARARDELAKDKRAVNGIVQFCVEGKPPVADDAKERFRRNESRLLGHIAATGMIPRSGLSYVRLATLVAEQRAKTAEIFATNPAALKSHLASVRSNSNRSPQIRRPRS